MATHLEASHGSGTESLSPSPVPAEIYIQVVVVVPICIFITQYSFSMMAKHLHVYSILTAAVDPVRLTSNTLLHRASLRVSSVLLVTVKLPYDCCF